MVSLTVTLLILGGARLSRWGAFQQAQAAVGPGAPTPVPVLAATPRTWIIACLPDVVGSFALNNVIVRSIGGKLIGNFVGGQDVKQGGVLCEIDRRSGPSTIRRWRKAQDEGAARQPSSSGALALGSLRVEMPAPSSRPIRSAVVAQRKRWCRPTRRDRQCAGDAWHTRSSPL